ncbi:MAG: hypothetical protein K0R73_481 [Candidatus Midichloriaceae bacterium]|nr:hypothetical protein [Candidatus Midichloriaceae bacterium]
MPTNYLKASHAYLEALSKYLDGEVTPLDSYHSDITHLDNFDVVILHYSVLIVRDSYLTVATRQALHDFRGTKVLIIQDEYRWINDTVSCMQFLEFDLLLTCMPNGYIEEVYPKAKLPNLKKINVLTGYVYDEMRNFPVKSYDERNLDVVYRAHKLSAWYGRLGREKWQIAEQFSARAKNLPIRSDVSYLSKDRIYGDKWIDFLCSSKCALGTESGASVFDFDDTIRKQVEKFETENPNTSFEVIEEKFFLGLDGKIKQNQISPRIFEYAACRNLMILFEGEYSGMMQPFEHYLPLKKDFSNFDEIITLIQDKQVWERITDKAYKELILSEKYTYKTFIEKLNLIIEELTRLKPPSSIGPLRKLASGSRVQGAHGTEDRSVLNIHKDLSTGALRQPAAEVEFPKRSIIAKKYTDCGNPATGTSSNLYRSLATLIYKMPKPIITSAKAIVRLLQKYKSKRFLNNSKLPRRDEGVVCLTPQEHKNQEFAVVSKEKICSICRWAIKGQD